jgi:hypothetical protein
MRRRSILARTLMVSDIARWKQVIERAGIERR